MSVWMRYGNEGLPYHAKMVVGGCTVSTWGRYGNEGLPYHA